uniref:DNA-directed DNA polymerase n=1 Tax=Tanacetum cinerariifolium TaxID=118510 RepID=A0A6L2J7V8_TANCI|nr:DNA-directed DNA polymerase [Tanacetum cinerariifolium]
MHIAPENQEKTMFTYPYGTFSYRRMPFGLCNAHVTFQRRMTKIFHDMVEDFIEEKCHFMVKEGIVLGHKFFGPGIEVDKAKSFLRHAGFYRREIADEFLDEQLMMLKANVNDVEPWLCPDDIMRRCVAHCHSRPTGGHHSASVTERKVYESGFFWPNIFKDARNYVMKCDAYQGSGNKSSRSEMPHNNIHKLSTKHIRLKQCNADLIATGKNPFMELNELAELRDEAYKNNRIYKERTRKWHDSRLRDNKDFKVLLFNSRFKLHPYKLKSKWYDSNTVKTVYPYGAIEITDKNEVSFKVNGQRLKKYYEGNINKDDSEVVKFEGDVTYDVEDKSNIKSLL